jgi:DNA-binding transcriptional LysR family regulator
VLRPPTQAEGVVVEVLRQEKLVELLPVQHPLAGERAVRLAALSGEWFLSHPGQPPSAMYGAMLQACRQAGFLPRVRQEVKETATLVAPVAAGLGVALVPASVQWLHLGGTAYRPPGPALPGGRARAGLPGWRGGPAAAPGLVASVRRPIARSRHRAMPSNETSDSPSAGISCDRESVST